MNNMTGLSSAVTIDLYSCEAWMIGPVSFLQTTTASWPPPSLFSVTFDENQKENCTTSYHEKLSLNRSQVFSHESSILFEPRSDSNYSGWLECICRNISSTVLGHPEKCIVLVWYILHATHLLSSFTVQVSTALWEIDCWFPWIRAHAWHPSRCCQGLERYVAQYPVWLVCPRYIIIIIVQVSSIFRPFLNDRINRYILLQIHSITKTSLWNTMLMWTFFPPACKITHYTLVISTTRRVPQASASFSISAATVDK